MSLVVAVWPVRMVTLEARTPAIPARNLMMAALALPSTGGAATRSFQVWPRRPANWVRGAPAVILSDRRVFIGRAVGGDTVPCDLSAKVCDAGGLAWGDNVERDD